MLSQYYCKNPQEYVTMSNQEYIPSFLKTRTNNSAVQFADEISTVNIQFVEKLQRDIQLVAIAICDRIIDKAVDAFRVRGQQGKFVPFSTYNVSQLDLIKNEKSKAQRALKKTSMYLNQNNSEIQLEIDNDDGTDDISTIYARPQTSSEKILEYTHGYHSRSYAHSSLFEASNDFDDKIRIDDYSAKTNNNGSKKRGGVEDKVTIGDKIYDTHEPTLAETLSTYAGNAYKTIASWYKTGTNSINLLECVISPHHKNLILKSNGIQKIRMIQNFVKNYLTINEDTLLIIADSIRNNEKINSVLYGDIDDIYTNIFKDDAKLWQLFETVVSAPLCVVIEDFFQSETQRANTTELLDIIRRNVIRKDDLKAIIMAIRATLFSCNGYYVNKLAELATDHFIAIKKNKYSEATSDCAEVLEFITTTMPNFCSSLSSMLVDLPVSARDAIDRLQMVSISGLGNYLKFA